MSNRLFSRFYASRSIQRLEVEADYRRDMLRGLSGRVLEVGCGHGLNFEFYPPEVDELVALDPEDYMLRRAKEHAWEVDIPIRVVKGYAEAMEVLGLGYFDAIVFSLVLCSVSDAARILHKAKLLLKLGGQIRFYEHHISDSPRLAQRQRRVGHFWPMIMGGCHPDRDTLALVAAQYVVTYSATMWVPNGTPGFTEITGPHTVGHAVLSSVYQR